MRTISLLLLPSIAAALECRYQAVKGLVKSQKHSYNTTAASQLDCVISNCRCDPACGASFNKDTGQCVVSSAGGRFEMLFARALSPIEEAGNDAWVTLVLLLPVPSGLWLFDNESKGKNFGTKGPKMNISVDGLTWTMSGPRGAASAFQYPTKDLKDNSKTPKIHLKDNGALLIDFSKPYTIAVWIKTVVTGSNRAQILEGYPQKSLDLWFWPSYGLDQLELGPYHDKGQDYRTVKNGNGASEWRHIAVSYESVSKVQMYLNGSSWALETSASGSQTVYQPDYFCLWQQCGKVNEGLRGSMACLTIYERALSQNEVRAVMDACP